MGGCTSRSTAALPTEVGKTSSVIAQSESLPSPIEVGEPSTLDSFRSESERHVADVEVHHAIILSDDVPELCKLDGCELPRLRSILGFYVSDFCSVPHELFFNAQQLLKACTSSSSPKAPAAVHQSLPSPVRTRHFPASSLALQRVRPKQVHITDAEDVAADDEHDNEESQQALSNRMRTSPVVPTKQTLFRSAPPSITTGWHRRSWLGRDDPTGTWLSNVHLVTPPPTKQLTMAPLRALVQQRQLHSAQRRKKEPRRPPSAFDVVTVVENVQCDDDEFPPVRPVSRISQFEVPLVDDDVEDLEC